MTLTTYISYTVNYLFFIFQSFFNFLIPDHNAKVFSPPNIHRRNTVDKYVEILLGGFLRWDGIYFLHIAEFGYTYENTLAFFPLYPLLIRALSNSLLLPLQYCMNYTNVLLVTAVLVNIISFVQTAKCLCNLTFTLFGSEQLALKVVQIFCLNPASVFFSAPYSEVTYSLFAFNGMLQVERNRLGLAAWYFALSGATRSNGLLNVAFIWHRQLRNFISTLSLSTEKDKYISWRQLIHSGMKTLLLSVCYAAVVITPFMAYQYYASKLFCNPFASYRDLPVHVLNYGNTNHYKMPHTGLSSWCQDVIPLSYSYVQKQHWGLGLLAYYQLKQVPNFLLALPVIIIGFASGVWFLKRNPRCCVNIGVVMLQESDTNMDSSRMQPHCCFYNSANFVYTVHMLSLIVFGILYMHVQVGC